MYISLVCGDCGYKLSGSSGELTHNEYPSDYVEDTSCEWTTDAKDRDEVKITFQLLKIEEARGGECSYDYLS